jgi:hypothetical protein
LCTKIFETDFFGFNSLIITLSRNATINTSMPSGIVKTERIPAMRIPFSWVTLNGGAGNDYTRVSRQQEVIQQMTQQLMLRESSHMQTSS